MAIPKDGSYGPHTAHYPIEISYKTLERIRKIRGIIQVVHTEKGFTVKKKREIKWKQIEDIILEIIKEEEGKL